MIIIISSGNCLNNNNNAHTIHYPENHDTPNIEKRHDEYNEDNKPMDDNKIKFEITLNELLTKGVGAIVFSICIGIIMGFTFGKCYEKNNIANAQKCKTVKYDTESEIE